MDERIVGCFRKTTHPKKGGYQGWEETKVADTLNAYDNSESRTPIVICLEGNGVRSSHMGPGYSECGVMYTLNTIEKHMVCYEKPAEVLVFKERAGKPGGGKGILIDKDKTFTLSTLQDEAICYEINENINNEGVE